MSGTLSSDGLDDRRRRLLFRAWHRGTREMDFVMGRFADAALADMDVGALDDYERLVDAPDPDLYDWIVGGHPPPPAYDTPLLARLRAFHGS